MSNRNCILDIHNWIMDIHKRMMYIRNWIMDIHDWSKDTHDRNMDIHNWLRVPIIDYEYPLLEGLFAFDFQ